MKHSHLRGLKLLFCATLALALVLGLMPAREAKAEWKCGSTCPACCSGVLSLSGSYKSSHDLTCSNPACVYFTIKRSDPHWGGTATCTQKAVCEGCGEEYGDYAQHTGGTATCIEKAVCEVCGQDYGDFGPHSGGAATCTDKAVCQTCGTKYGSALGHDWETEWSYDENGHYHKCLNDGCTAKNDEAAHSGGTATCTEKAKCETCGQEYGSALGHKWDTEWSYDENGHYHKCLNDGCTAKNDEAAHSGGVATCTDKAVCETCGTKYGSALGHDWETEWTIDGDVHYHACSRCTERNDEASHSYTWTYVDDNTCKGVCICGAEITDAHYDRWATYCDYQPHCEKCDHDYGPKNEHDMYYEYRNENNHKPNCRKGCDTWFFLEAHSGGTATCDHAPVCEKCGHEYGSALGHKWDTEWSYDENGHFHKCLNDGCSAKNDEAAHSGGTATCTEKAKCETCGQEYGSALGHKWDTEWSYDENGHFHKCLNDGCSAKNDEAAHSGGKATCTEKAKCETCGHEYGSALGHDLIDHAAQAPTCTAIGWGAYQTCSRCDYTTYVEKPALGHDLIDHAAQAPTCTAIGWDAYQTCSRCDYTTYVEKPALGHAEVTDPAVNPTCTESGKTEGKHCSVCGEVLVAQKPIPAIGHNYAVTGTSIIRVYYRCSGCGDSYWMDNAYSKNMIPDLVRDEHGKNVNYTARVSRENGKRVLTVTPDLHDDEAAVTSLWLKPEYVEQWIEQGVSVVKFQRNNAVLEIELAAITPDWFALSSDADKISHFVFTLDPGTDNALVEVSAALGGQKAPANTLTGITLRLDEAEISVTQNGMYPMG